MQTVLQVDGGASMQSLTPLLGLGALVAKDHEGTLWVRVDATSETNVRRIACVPGSRFVIHDECWLIRPEEKIATAKLAHDLAWEPLDQVVQIELPSACFAPRHTAIGRRPLKLVRGGEPSEPAAIIAALADFHRWVDMASEIRLRRLRWLWRGEQVLVMGNPLPPIDARYLIAIDRILRPAGHVWMPALPSADVKDVFAVGQNQWLVWQSQQSWDVVDDDQFMSLRRASLRRLSAMRDGSAEQVM